MENLELNQTFQSDNMKVELFYSTDNRQVVIVSTKFDNDWYEARRFPYKKESAAIKRFEKISNKWKLVTLESEIEGLFELYLASEDCEEVKRDIVKAQYAMSEGRYNVVVDMLDSLIELWETEFERDTVAPIRDQLKALVGLE